MKKKVVYNYPPINLPSHIKETKYTGYYISENGDAYRAPGKYDRNEQYGKINEWGLIYLKPGLRGHPKYPEKQYHSVNVSTKNENGIYKQIKKSNHQLVAETFVPNPHGYTEVMHIDENNRNNHYTNLKWGTHKENLQVKHLPEGTIREHTHGNSKNPTKYIKKDRKWVLIPSDRPPWNKGMKSGLPDGTIRKQSNGHYKIKTNGDWVHLHKKDYDKYNICHGRET